VSFDLTNVNACKFDDISGGGLLIGRIGEKDAHPDDEREIVHDDEISNCYLTHIGAEYNGAAGIFAGYARDVGITHNEIAHTSYSGVSLGWGWGFKVNPAVAFMPPRRMILTH